MVSRKKKMKKLTEIFVLGTILLLHYTTTHIKNNTVKHISCDKN